MSELPKPLGAPGNTPEAMLMVRAYHRQWRRDMEAFRDWLRGKAGWTTTGASVHTDSTVTRNMLYVEQSIVTMADEIEAALKEATT